MICNCLFVGLGGFVGSILRYLCGFLKFDGLPFPVITLGINVIGSFAIMFLFGVFSKSVPLDDHWMLFLRVGLCGGFTTFSTFSAEVLEMFESGEPLSACIYAALSFALCLGAAFLGQVSSHLMVAQS